MQGLAERTNALFEAFSKLECLKGYTLIGGTALSLQIGKRLSEDLDFCKWSTNLKKDKPTIDWPVIEKELETVGSIESRNILGFEQVNFNLSGVKVSFIAKQGNLSPVKEPILILNNIQAGDLISLGAMKIEVMLRRSEWRDYYDIYSLLMEGLSLKEMVNLAGIYSNHRLKSKDALNFLSNCDNYKKEKSFNLLKPFYDVSGKEIEDLIKATIRKEYLS
jgi:predicted nucleotidyltransferase component of viral defense system